MEACPYTIRHDKDREALMETEREKAPGTSCEMHESQRPSADNSTHDFSGMMEADGEYGPWMVVSKKRNGYKGTKSGPNLVGTSKSIWEIIPHQSSYNMDQMEKGKRGWTKAQAPTRRRPNSEYAKSSENAPTSSTQFTSNTDGLPLILGPGFEVLSSTPKMSPSSRQFPASVKGKKNLTRFKTSNSFYKSTVAPQTKECSLNSPFSFNNYTTLSDHALKPPSSAPFEFKTLTRGELDHTTRGGNDQGTKDCY